MRLADTPVPARAAGDADAVTADGPSAPSPSAPGASASSPSATGSSASSPAPPGPSVPGTAPAFAIALAALEAGRDATAAVREDLAFEEWPAPKRLAAHAVAVAATAYRDGEEAGTGRLMLLFDPAGQDGWTGTFRVVVQVHADVEEEMAADPLLGQVGWSWLTDALDLHASGYRAPSGTVTRVITEGYGTKEDEALSTGFELRASWCPDDEEIADEIYGAVLAWCDVLIAAAGLPAQPLGTRALDSQARGQRAGTRGRRRR
jgi:hypothetical protein